MFTPIKSKSHGVPDDAVNTPQLQATSTVRRKSTPKKSRFDGKLHLGGKKGRQARQGLSYENEPPQREDTLLGLLENISDTNKDNNVNVQNITGNMSVPNFDSPIKTGLNKENHMDNSISKVSVAFEPNEITACSSGVSIKAKRQTSAKAFHDFSKAILEELNCELAKISDKKSLSGSKIAEQLSIDEARWHQDRTYVMPVMNTEKQKMDFGSLSGITGEVDLSIESSAGRKVSVGQYLERKSGNIGILGNNEKVKPNLGGISETPIKTGNLAALVESTILSDAELTDNDRTFIPNERDVDENSIISSTTIVNTFQDVDSEARRLIDQLSKKKNPVIQDNARKETYKENYLQCPNNNVVFLSPTTSRQNEISDRSGPGDQNKIPIRVTHTALVWNSVKTGKSEIKELTIWNTSYNNIKIQLDICNYKNFEFVIDKQITTTNLILAMQRQERRTLPIVFSPKSIGPVAGKVIIKYLTRGIPSDTHEPKKIPLYGYGGCSKVKIAGTFKDLRGKMLLPLGNLYSETTTLGAHITLDNVGDLCSFAKITVIPKAISPTMDSSWHVNPKEVMLNPKESQQVKIQFHPKKKDFALLQRSEVSHIATIYVTYEDELTRWRIRRLYDKIRSGESTGYENEAFKNIVHPICKIFSGEQQIPDLQLSHDSIQNLGDLCTGVHQYEIMLTVEVCADDTLPVHYDTDESQMCQSLNNTIQID